MSNLKKTVRVEIQLNREDKAEAEMLTEQYYGLSLAQFLKLVTKLLIHERLDMQLDLKATNSNIEDTAP